MDCRGKKNIAENVELQFDEALKETGLITGFNVKMFYVTVKEIPNHHKYPFQK